jgi:hypothetical protein
MKDAIQGSSRLRWLEPRPSFGPSRVARRSDDFLGELDVPLLYDALCLFDVYVLRLHCLF